MTNPAEQDLVDQYFVGTSNVDDSYSRLHKMHVENKRLQEDVFGYRAGFFILLSLMVAWGIALTFNRTPTRHLNSCEALKYYLGALNEASSSLPIETHRLLDAQAAACTEDDLGSFDDGNPNH